MRGKITVTAIVNYAMQRTVEAVEAAGAEWEELSKKRAPVRKKPSSTSSKVRLKDFSKLNRQQRQLSINFFTIETKDKERVTSRKLANAYATFISSPIPKNELKRRGEIWDQKHGRPYPVVMDYRVSYRKIERERGAFAATLFEYSSGSKKGQTPEEVFIRGGSLRGREKEEAGGTLRDSIKFLGVRKDGMKVTGTLVASAPYAHYVEYGFHHNHGTSIPANPFMRGPLHNNIVPDFKAGKYFKKG